MSLTPNGGPRESTPSAQPEGEPVYVSVLMPVYNGERFLDQAIESILTQTHVFFEFLIINDGSTDGTQAILDRYAARDPRIRVVSQENRGQPATLNRGLQLAKYDWVAITDHDDISFPMRLEKQITALSREPDVRLVGTRGFRINAAGARMGNGAGKPLGPTTVAEFRDLQSAGERVKMFHASVLMHRPTVLALGGYDPAFGPSADSELWTRVTQHHVALVVPEPLVLYRVHQGSMSFREMARQRELLGWTDARHAARHAGRPVPTLDEYREACRPGSLFERVRQEREEFSWYLRARRRYATAEGHWGSAVFFGVCGTLVAPLRAIRAALRIVN